MYNISDCFGLFISRVTASLMNCGLQRQTRFQLKCTVEKKKKKCKWKRQTLKGRKRVLWSSKLYGQLLIVHFWTVHTSLYRFWMFQLIVHISQTLANPKYIRQTNDLWDLDCTVNSAMWPISRIASNSYLYMKMIE